MHMSNSVAAIPDKTLAYCFEASPTGFDANQARTNPDFTVSSVILYNRLVDFERGGTKIEPSLAERWDISEDGKVYTFHLRRGVKFHTTPWFKPTRDFNAEDVLFTFERMRKLNMSFRKAYPVEFTVFHHSSLDKIISKIEALDKGHTVRFTLNTVHAPFLSKLAAPFTSILSAEYAAQLLKEGNPSDISWKPIGTGPFIFEKYVKDATIRFNGNPEYWKLNDVQLSKLIFDITPDAAVRMQKLKANECQVVTDPRLTDIPAFERDPDFQVLSQTSFTISYLAYNAMHKPLNDVRVRRALDMAIDKKAIIDQVYEGRAQTAVAPMPLLWSYDKTLQDAPRDLKEAKRLLTQAGYPNGFALPLWTHPPRPYNPNPRLMAEMIQSDWKKIDVKAEIVTYELVEHVKRSINGEHDALLTGIVSSIIPDPDHWFRVFSCTEIGKGFNVSRWCNPSFDDLIQRATKTLDITERSRLYTQAQKLLKREQPITPIAHATNYQVISKRVTGFKINPLGLTIFSGVGLAE